MPRYPDLSPTIVGLPGSTFARSHKRATPVRYPLHIGDTWMEPPPGTRMEDLKAADHPGLHRYAPVSGRPDLVSAVARSMQRRTGVDVDEESVLITAGATGALGAVLGAVVDPEDEVLVVAPHWPLITGIVRSFRAKPVSVPLIGAVETATAAVDVLDRHLTSKTVAVYWNTPNNPTGRMLPARWLDLMVEWASRRELWILADEVYEHYAYEAEHSYTLSRAPECTFSVHSFSKAFGMAGNRCGFAVAPAAALEQVKKVSTHSVYAAPTASQVAAARALEPAGDAWLAKARAAYARLGAEAAECLGMAPPEGGTFLFLDVAADLGAAGLAGFLSRCAAEGLLLAPGTSFGPYPTHVRVCFTAAPPEVTRAGIRLLARLLER